MKIAMVLHTVLILLRVLLIFIVGGNKKLQLEVN